MTARPASRMPAPGRNSGRTRAGFTLIELMGVILIIAILIAIALPAFNAVMRNARMTAARSEMAAIGTSIAEFKSQFNMEPPSYIDFRPVGGEIPPQTKAILRQMFPQIDLSSDADMNGQPDYIPRLDAVGLLGKEFKGSEALVFFLGGMRQSGTTELTGFSKNPANPFVPPTAGQSNRIGPFFEFDSGRLRERKGGPPDNPSAEVPLSRDGNLVYLDKLPGQSMPILYASTARTGSLAEVDVRATPRTFPPDKDEEVLDDFYNDGFLPIDQDGNFNPADFNPATPKAQRYGLYKKSSGESWSSGGFILVSPGSDATYGRGGLFSPGSTANINSRDADNLTNFHGGQLGG